MTNHVRSINESALGASDLDSLPNCQGSQVFGDVAGGVGFYKEIEIAGLVVARNWSVRANDFLGCAIGLLNVGADRNMLANWETKNSSWLRKLESVAGSN